MDITSLLQIMQNNLTQLQASQTAAFNSGDLTAYNNLQTQINEQQILISQLQSIVVNT